ncbi:MAG: diaminobutyrate--2-oxoglutarate transaminase [Actinomycetota bacterium]|nr:diaminobutyrate--2-oxoglutarate transaminase [Actinomycetota bacterium]
MEVFEALESEVRSYCRNWPAVFDRALGSWLYDESGRPYLDLFAGAGALNYGHNNPALKQPLLDYLGADRVTHSLDMFTAAKRDFLTTVHELLLAPRGLDYRVQFPGPSGNNAVEAALKLARKLTGRTEVVCFTGGFHGVTLGALAVTANPTHRKAAGVPLKHATPMPFDHGLDGQSPDFSALDRLLEGGGSELPAAVIVEAVQGEGGVRLARETWLRELAVRCCHHEIPLIVDEVQMGCGRTGPFFSFEPAQIRPDIVCLSKSISGYGLPLALTLIRPELDVWEPGEHNGTFRGFNPALVTGAAALRTFWSDDDLHRRTLTAGRRLAAALTALAGSVAHGAIEVRGRGLVHGLAFRRSELAARVSAAAFARGLLVETAGPRDEVVKLMPPLTITDEELDEALVRLTGAVEDCCGGK